MLLDVCQASKHSPACPQWSGQHASPQHAPGCPSLGARWEADRDALPSRRRVDLAIEAAIADVQADQPGQDTCPLTGIGEAIDHQWVILEGTSKQCRRASD